MLIIPREAADKCRCWFCILLQRGQCREHRRRLIAPPNTVQGKCFFQQLLGFFTLCRQTLLFFGVCFPAPGGMLVLRWTSQAAYFCALS